MIRRILLMVAALAAIYATPAHADLNAEMQDMFGSLVNVTSPTAHLSQRRGVLAGGSVQIRNRVMHPNLISFVPPSIAASCSGIDLFGGSFSFINKDQFVQLARSIASNAAGYAFSLAMESMCPTCAQEMNRLQALIQKMNALTKNSCDTAKWLVNKTGLDDWANDREAESSLIATSLGSVNDFFEGFFPDSGEPESVARTAAGQDPTTGEVPHITVNIVWKSLKESSVATWYTHGDDHLYEAIMSLTGTQVVIFPPDAEKPSYVTRIPTLKIRDLLQGGDDLSFLRCDTATACLNVTTSAGNTLTGMRDRVLEVLLGSPETGVGLVDKFRYNSGALSTEEEAFLESVPAPVGAMVHNLASEPGMPTAWVHEFADVIALQLTVELVEEMFRSATAAVQGKNEPLDTAFLPIMRDVRQDLNEERKTLAEQKSSLESMMAVYRYAVESLHGQQDSRLATLMPSFGTSTEAQTEQQ